MKWRVETRDNDQGVNVFRFGEATSRLRCAILKVASLALSCHLAHSGWCSRIINGMKVIALWQVVNSINSEVLDIFNILRASDAAWLL